MKNDANRRVTGGNTLLVLGVLDAVIQLYALVPPPPFHGIGIVAFPLLPVILVTYAALLVAILAGIPLALACFRGGGALRLGLGAVLGALSVANAFSIIRFIMRQ